MELQTAPRDIAFDCPLCRGHLVAQSSQIGTSADCPHCNQLLFVPKASYVDDETALPGVRRIIKRTKARISQPKLNAPPSPDSPLPREVPEAKEEINRAHLAAVEAELLKVRSEIAVERENAKKTLERAAELEADFNRQQEIGLASIAGLETRIAGLQEQLDTSILEIQSLSRRLGDERESSRQSALEIQKLRDQLSQKSDASHRAEARSTELEIGIERSVKDASSKITAFETEIADLRRQLTQNFQIEQSRA